MLLTEYREQYDNAPEDITDFAEGAIAVTNCVVLSQAAEEFLSARDHFLEVMNQYDITIG